MDFVRWDLLIVLKLNDKSTKNWKIGSKYFKLVLYQPPFLRGTDSFADHAFNTQKPRVCDQLINASV